MKWFSLTLEGGEGSLIIDLSTASNKLLMGTDLAIAGRYLFPFPKREITDYKCRQTQGFASEALSLTEKCELTGPFEKERTPSHPV